MKRAYAWSLALLLATSLVLGGCARTARGTEPGMAAPLGPSGLSRDSRSYMANDPP